MTKRFVEQKSAAADCILCQRECPRRFAVGAYAIHRCAPCDLEFVWPTPSVDELNAVYAGGYFSGGGPGYEDYAGREREYANAKSRVRLGAIASLRCERGRLLDMGCASGYFLTAARERGFEVRGVEPSSEARASLPADLEGAVLGTLDEAAAYGPYNVITLWDVLEHLPDPVRTLRQVREMAVPGAVIGVVVPVIGNINTRWLPHTWDQYKPPEHLWYFSRHSLRALLSREVGTVVREGHAWSRPGRFHDPEGRQAGRFHSALRSVDRALGRALALPLGPEALVDSVAFYVRRH